MIKKWYSTATFGGKISLGKAGEGEAVQLKIDVSEWLSAYPDAQVKLFVTPPKPLNPYFAGIDGPEGGEILWTIRKADTQQAGSGTLELLLLQGEDKLIKSATASTVIASSPSASSAAGDAPEVHPTWWEGALEKIGEAENQALSSVEAAKSAAVGAVEGKFDEEVEAGKAAVQAAGSAQTQAVNQAGAAQQSAIENKGANTLASIPEDYTAVDADVKALKDTKADAIWDMSARAASHELHAQRGPMSVTLHGKTTETGSGDKSPDNPYVITGVDAAKVRAGGKNLIKGIRHQVNTSGLTITENADGSFKIVGTPTTRVILYFFYSALEKVYLPAGTFTLSSKDALTQGVNVVLGHYKGGKYAGNLGYLSYLEQKRTYTYSEPSGALEGYVEVQAGTNVDMTIAVQLEAGSVATAYESYIANTLDLPLLPDGAPLMGNGTVDDTVGNDVLSGCDKRIVLDGTQEIAGFYTNYAAFSIADLDDACPVFSDYLNSGIWGITTIPASYPKCVCLRRTGGSVFDEMDKNGVLSYLAANPLTVYYRSTDYTPDKDIRVARVTRKWKTLLIDGSEVWNLFGSDVYPNLFVCNQQNTLAGADKSSCSHYLYFRGKYDENCYYFATDNKLMINAVDYTDKDAFKAHLKTEHDAGQPVTIAYQLATPEIYMTDRRILCKPDGLPDDKTTTVTGSGKTEVEYPHKTKHYIDQKFDALAAALLS